MPRTTEQLRRDVLEIWHAGVEAVRSERLVQRALRVEEDALILMGGDGDQRLTLKPGCRIVVVGAGKAGAGMVQAVESVLGDGLLDQYHVTGWVNVPADCVRPTRRIRLHAARPAGVNEPTEAGVAGAEQILRLVESLGADDVCLCLISGGGSALMPAPVEGVTLADKLAITRHLSASGANIEQLNCVRKQLSRIKGGGLATACRGGRLVSLIISDVLGDPLDVIASGPTVEDSSTPAAALEILERFGARRLGIAPQAVEYLAHKASRRGRPACAVVNRIIGNNAMAVDAAGRAALRLGYESAMVAADRSEGAAEDVGRHLAGMALEMRSGAGPDCLVSGGEPVVTLVDRQVRGLGGRNQQLVLAAQELLEDDGARGIALLSGGTDGEDGPTDAAGAWIDAAVVVSAQQRGLVPADFLARNDAYHFFEPLGSLLKTGPTHTNVCDLRVVVVDRA